MRNPPTTFATRDRAAKALLIWAVCRATIALLAILATLLMLSVSSRGQEATDPNHHPVIVLDVEGAIGPATTEYLRQGFEIAAEQEAALIILQMDTPGGLASSTRDIVQDILASPIPVVTYVAPGGARAASAGTYILYSSHLAAMAPGTNLGAATPIQLDGGAQPLGGSEEDDGGEETPQPLADASSAKAVNDAVASIRSLAEIHGRNADWAEQAVRQAVSLSSSAALEQGVIEIIAADLPDLLAQAEGRTIQLGGQTVTLETARLEIVTIEPDWRSQILSVITNPNIAYILLLIGLYGIIFELIAPGTIFPGVVGAIALVIGLFALNLLPINLAGAGLMLLGIGLMVAEAFVASFGILGIGGVVAFAAGSLFLFEEVPGFKLSLPVVVTATAASAVLLAIMLAAIVRAHRRKVVSGEPAMIGSTGEVLTWSNEGGQIQVHGERWQARSAKPLVPGERVRVTGRDKLTLDVEPETPS